MNPTSKATLFSRCRTKKLQDLIYLLDIRRFANEKKLSRSNFDRSNSSSFSFEKFAVHSFTIWHVFVIFTCSILLLELLLSCVMCPYNCFRCRKLLLCIVASTVRREGLKFLRMTGITWELAKLLSQHAHLVAVTIFTSLLGWQRHPFIRYLLEHVWVIVYSHAH